ncbi:ORF6C domain-containing protein [Staphylococcus haemolyticus]|uniref:ORF6C domain-containing protein n=1 Tax=Staphylococcus haemolyticus TaxID=1283 RepID=UPI001F58C83C|nr:ORF6C domain-containing protein [Staphylococcus haemolyticus]MCI2949865.1 ORF6C domain-containing protein [Staphylococcus haemolyticus]
MSNQTMELSRTQMENMVAQAQSALQMYDKIVEIEERMNQTALRTEIRLDKIENSYPLLDTEADRIQSMAMIKARQFTKQLFAQEVSQELFSKKFGHIISGVYRAIKNQFHVRKYTLVKHVDAEKAVAFVEQLKLTDLPPRFLRLTDHQIDVAERHGDFEVLKRLA